MENIIEVGLIKGRHEMPVNEYLFDGDIEDVFDYHFYVNDEYLTVLVQKQNGEEGELESEKE